MSKHYLCSSKQGLTRKLSIFTGLMLVLFNRTYSSREIYSEKEPEGNVDVWGLFEGFLACCSRNTYFCLTWQVSFLKDIFFKDLKIFVKNYYCQKNALIVNCID